MTRFQCVTRKATQKPRQNAAFWLAVGHGGKSKWNREIFLTIRFQARFGRHERNIPILGTSTSTVRLSDHCRLLYVSPLPFGTLRLRTVIISRRVLSKVNFTGIHRDRPDAERRDGCYSSVVPVCDERGREETPHMLLQCSYSTRLARDGGSGKGGGGGGKYVPVQGEIIERGEKEPEQDESRTVQPFQLPYATCTVLFALICLYYSIACSSLL